MTKPKQRAAPWFLDDYKNKTDSNFPDYLIPAEELKEFLLKNKFMLFDEFNTDIDTVGNKLII